MAKKFSIELLKWYHASARELPWRKTKDPYSIWVSEAMLQQTMVKTVIGYYDKWLTAFPTVQALAKAPIDKVLKAWQGLGYYNRARNFHKAAQIVVGEFDGKVPCDPAVLRSLPGFGPYMTASVASIAFDVRVPLVDANVRRVIMRIKNIHGAATNGLDPDILEYLNSVMLTKSCGDFNQALMELGAMVCTTKEPKCNMCPLKFTCKAFDEGCQELIPEPKKVSIKEVTAVVALIQKGSKYLIQQRPAKGLLADLWEFPGGKVEKTDKSPQKALEREIQEELGTGCVIRHEICRVRHYYTTHKVNLTAFDVSLAGDTFKLKDHQRWASIREMDKYPMPSGSAKIVEKVRAMAVKP